MATVVPGASSPALASRRSLYSRPHPRATSLLIEATRLFSSALLPMGRRSERPLLSRRSVPVWAATSSSPFLPSAIPGALLFDCDGVLVDTEKDGHRISFNETFTEKELGFTWDVDLYGELLKIGGGKERMTAYFNNTAWPKNSPMSEEERKGFIAALHKRKTELFMTLIEQRLLPLRPGVQRLIDEALAKGVKVGVCSTSNEKAVSAIVSFLLGPERADKIAIFAGDVVPKKKPDPAIYLLAANTFGVEPSRYTAEENFLEADAVFDCIGDPPKQQFDLEFCAKLLQKQYVS